MCLKSKRPFGQIKRVKCERNMCKVSILLAVYNSQETLKRAMDSAVTQSLKDIEIICVDDMSTDASRDILSTYARKDVRVRVIENSRNEGILAARKLGIQAAKGCYILFLDPDDALDKNACETLYRRMEKTGADILQFPARAIPARADISKSQIREVQKRLKLPIVPPQGEHIFLTHCCTQQYWHVLWNKIYRAQLCKQAASVAADCYLILSDDLYLFGLISFFARRYSVIRSAKPLYDYYYGCGISSKKEININDFRMVCSSTHAVGEMKNFLTGKGLEDKYRAYLHENMLSQLRYACRVWAQQLNLSDQPQGFDMLVSAWPKEYVVASLREEDKILRSDICRGIESSQSIRPNKNTPVQTLGIYYPKLENGGAERVISLQINEWISRYRIVLFTDEACSGEEYEIPSDVERIVLPPKDSPKRYQCLLQAMTQFNIDLFLYEAWLERNLLWDVLSIKLCGVPCIIVAHSPIIYWKEWFANRLDYSECIDSITMADGIVTLSEQDSSYWKRRHMLSQCILNPCDPRLLTLKRSELQGAKLLWVGRISREKHLEDIIKAFEVVAEKRPDAELTIVGSGDDTDYNRTLTELIRTMKCKDNIHRVGYKKNPYHYYQDAEILVLASEFEGFSLTILEGKAAGVPCVAYDCPASYFFEEKKGILSVENGNIDAMAEKILFLLNDLKALQKLSDEAYESFEEYRARNVFTEWDHFFDELLSGIEGQYGKAEHIEDARLAARKFELQLSEKEVRRALRLACLWKMYCSVDCYEKMKLIAKLFLRLFGKKLDFHDEQYKIADDMLENMKQITESHGEK